MDILTISSIGAIIVAVLYGVFQVIKLIRKKNVKVVVKEVPVPVTVQPLPKAQAFLPTIKVKDRDLYKQFITEYDDGLLKFDNVPFRPGAHMSCAFGISEGYRYYVKGTNRLWNEKDGRASRDMRWGYVRPHMGVDRAGAKPYTLTTGEVVGDVVRCPFNFNRSQIVDYGDTSYGTLVSLFNDKYQFEFRFCHMDPKKDFIPWSLNRLKSKGSFEQGWVFGSAGNYGNSSGAHTHTELKSYDETCEVLDLLLEELHGDSADKEYSAAQVAKEYKKYTHFKDASNKEIQEDWSAWKRLKKIIFANQYKITRIDPLDGETKTWYSTYHLFNKL
jgi:hypothetical protein